MAEAIIASKARSLVQGQKFSFSQNVQVQN